MNNKQELLHRSIKIVDNLRSYEDIFPEQIHINRKVNRRDFDDTTRGRLVEENRRHDDLAELMSRSACVICQLAPSYRIISMRFPPVLRSFRRGREPKRWPQTGTRAIPSYFIIDEGEDHSTRRLPAGIYDQQP